MANRVFMYGSHSADRTREPSYDEGDVLCAASYCVPYFWLYSFETASVYRFRDAETDDEFTGLLIDRSMASQLFSQRMAAALQDMPESVKQQSVTWQTYLDSLPFAYIGVDCRELDVMNDAGVFAQQLRDALTLVRDKVERFMGKQCGFTKSDLAHNKQGCLCGYRWARDIPWQEPQQASTQTGATPGAASGWPMRKLGAWVATKKTGTLIGYGVVAAAAGAMLAWLLARGTTDLVVNTGAVCFGLAAVLFVLLALVRLRR